VHSADRKLTAGRLHPKIFILFVGVAISGRIVYTSDNRLLILEWPVKSE
jgi:hypothetical protein